ncbi:MAG: multicopper oxidase family protein [Kiloniellales bacterium]|nr:multicopper oxidase family protein [Kiloniellales bacterium]
MNRRSFLSTAGSALALSTLAPRLSPAEASAAVKVLEARLARAPLMGDAAAPTAVWGYNGRVPGPVIRARQGKKLHLRFENGLDQPSTVHWHGIRIDNAMDGVAGLTQAAVRPGESFDYVFTPPDAGTFWYHPHNRTWEQMARGLYGLLIVEEAEAPAVDRDLALAFDDWRLDGDGQIDEASLGRMRDWAHAGRLGNWLTVNGVSQPEIALRKGERLRLRLANCCNARVLSLRLDGHAAWLVALDGQPIAPYQPADGVVTLAPAQRADLVVDAVLGPGARTAILEVGGAHAVETAFLAYRPEAPTRDRPLPPPAALPDNPLPRSLDLGGALRRELLMEGGAMGRMASARFKGRRMGLRELVDQGKAWAFNGTAGMTDEPLLRVERGRTAVIEMINDTAWPHALHLHGHHVRVVERDGSAQTETPWRDTVLLQRNEKASIAFLADNPGKWMLHCHMLEHQAAGMATWIEVLG